MKWHRVEPGTYTAGPYLVEATYTSGGWYASGPGVDSFWLHKNAAQLACGNAAAARAADPATKPVIGDAVTVGGRHGTVGSIMATGSIETLYCIKFVRGKRLCLFRHEFEVIVP